MLQRATRFGLLTLLAMDLSCSGGDYAVTRQGGPFPTYPAQDPPLGGSGGTEGVEGDAGAAMGGAGPGGAPAALTPWCDAYAVMEAKCHRCHNEPQLYGAPFSLLTWADTQAKYSTSKVRYQRMQDVVTSGFMPLVDANGPPLNAMPPVEPLTDEEKITLLQWLGEGAPRETDSTCP